MAKNRTTTQRGKRGNAKHNEHKFLDDNRDVYSVSFCHDKQINEFDLEKDEIRFYKKNYSTALTKQNDKYIAKSNYARCKSIEEYYRSKRYCPTEEICQYGHVNGEVPDRETFITMINELVDWRIEWSALNGNHLHVLDYTIHFDEATPHGHIREIWDYVDEDGVIRPGQETAMCLAGLELPAPDKPVGRYNNRGMTWTAMCRSKWQDICEEHGFDVERVPLPSKRKHETINQYKDRMDREIENERMKLEAEREKLIADQKTLEKDKETYKEKMSKANDLRMNRLEKKYEAQKKAELARILDEEHINIIEYQEFKKAHTTDNSQEAPDNQVEQESCFGTS